MFTFREQTGDPLFYIDDRPVYTQWKKDESARIAPFRDTGNYLDSDEFREEFNLTKKEAEVLSEAIQHDSVPEDRLKTKFYQIRKDLNAKLFTTIDLRGTDKEINWRFPKDVKQWPTSAIIQGSSGTGKTFQVLKWIEESLKRKKKRKFIYLSPELNTDETLKRILNNRRWAKYFEGVDLSDEAFEEYQRQEMGATVDTWWTNVVKPILYNAPEGTLVCMDDSPDCMLHHYLLAFLTKWLRTGRHKKVGVISIQHRIRGGKWTSQSFSSVKWIWMGIRGGGRGNLVQWLYEMTGMGMRKCRNLVEDMAEHSRFMCMHQWAPGILFSSKHAVFI